MLQDFIRHKMYCQWYNINGH